MEFRIANNKFFKKFKKILTPDRQYGRLCNDELPKTVGTVWCKYNAYRGRIVKLTFRSMSLTWSFFIEIFISIEKDRYIDLNRAVINK